MGDAVAQWIRLQLPSCSPGFISQAHNLRFFHLSSKVAIFVVIALRKGQKKKKETGFGSFLQAGKGVWTTGTIEAIKC